MLANQQHEVSKKGRWFLFSVLVLCVVTSIMIVSIIIYIHVVQVPEAAVPTASKGERKGEMSPVLDTPKARTRFTTRTMLLNSTLPLTMTTMEPPSITVITFLSTAAETTELQTAKATTKTIPPIKITSPSTGTTIEPKHPGENSERTTATTRRLPIIETVIRRQSWQDKSSKVTQPLASLAPTTSLPTKTFDINLPGSADGTTTAIRQLLLTATVKPTGPRSTSRKTTARQSLLTVTVGVETVEPRRRIVRRTETTRELLPFTLIETERLRRITGRTTVITTRQLTTKTTTKTPHRHWHHRAHNHWHHRAHNHSKEAYPSVIIQPPTLRSKQPQAWSREQTTVKSKQTEPAKRWFSFLSG